MWIQVRTIDGAQTRTIDDLSRLTKIESLREKIQESFRVSPELQRLFNRGKQVRKPRQTLPLPPASQLCAACSLNCRSSSVEGFSLPPSEGKEAAGDAIVLRKGTAAAAAASFPVSSSLFPLHGRHLLIR